MSSNMVRQSSFFLGEVDIVTWKRTDEEGYLKAAQSLLNCEIATTGLAKKRRGSNFLLDVTSYVDPNSQIYEFNDQYNVPYIVLTGNLTAEIFKITFPGGVITVTHFATLVTPYLSADLPDIDYALENDTLVLVHPNYQPARIYVTTYTATIPTFAYQALNIFPIPAYDFNDYNYNNAGVTPTISSPTSTFVFAQTGIEAHYDNTWIGGLIIGAGTNSLLALGYGYITVVDVSTPNQVTFTVNVVAPFLSVGMPVIGSQYSIRKPAWSSSAATPPYPSAVSFYQNRLWLANTLQLGTTVFGSKINNPLNFDVGIGLDTDAIVFTIGQSGSGNIIWINGGKQLEFYCDNYEFAAPQQENLGLTPGTFSIRQQATYGSSVLLKPITYLNDSYYVNGTGKAILNFHFDGIGQAYTSTNISVASQHLVKNPNGRALLRGDSTDQDNFIFFLNSTDNTLTVFQFAPEYKLAALTPATFDLSVQMKAIVSVANQIYILKKYSLSNKSVLEVMDSTQKMDSANQTTIANTGIYVNGQQLGIVTGLSIYNGVNVRCVYQNQDYGVSVDVNGNPAPVASGQAYFFNNGNAGAVTIGITYPVDIVPMYIFSGATESNFYKNISRIFVDYYQSLDFQVNGTQVPFQTYDIVQLGLPPVPITDTAVISPTLGWNRFKSFAITQNSPFDLQITAISYQVASAII